MRVTLADAVADPHARQKLADRLGELYPDDKFADRGAFNFSEEEIDQARAAHCLIEYSPKKKTIGRTVRFIIAPAFAADLAERAVTRIEREVAESREREAKAGA